MKVSVIIPCYNVEKTLDRCLESVMNQTYPLYEIICIDDCSTDGTLEKLQKYQGIKLIMHDQNKGLGITRQDGIAAATGDYIYFLDSDDYLHPDAIGYLVKNADGGDIVTGGVDSKPLSGLNALKAYYKTAIFLCNRLIKRELFEKAPHSGIRYFEDADTLPRLIYFAKKCTYAPLKLYYYNTRNENGLCNTASKVKKLIYQVLVTLHNIDFFKDKGDYLYKLPLTMTVLKYLTDLAYEVNVNGKYDEFNEFDEQTTEICSRLSTHLLEALQPEQEGKGNG